MKNNMNPIYRFYTKEADTEKLKNKSKILIVATQENGKSLYACSRCSNKDQFDKLKARLIAEGRLHKRKLIDVKNEPLNIQSFLKNCKDLIKFIDEHKITKIPDLIEAS
jgi:hypothetical protein